MTINSKGSSDTGNKCGTSMELVLCEILAAKWEHMYLSRNETGILVNMGILDSRTEGNYKWKIM